MGKKRKILPNQKEIPLFFCHSYDTDDTVTYVQNRLLRINVNLYSRYRWLPYDWRLLLPLSQIGEDRGLQSVINEHISISRCIIFVIKENIGEGLKQEWSFCKKKGLGKYVHLLICGDSKFNTRCLCEALDTKDEIAIKYFSNAEEIVTFITNEIFLKIIKENNNRIRQGIHNAKSPKDLSKMSKQLEVLTEDVKRLPDSTNTKPILVELETVSKQLNKKASKLRVSVSVHNRLKHGINLTNHQLSVKKFNFKP